MVIITHFRPHGQGWIEIDPQIGIDRLSLKRALQTHYKTKIDVIMIEDQKPMERPEIFYKCQNCGIVYVAMNHGQQGQHLVKSPFALTESDVVEPCYAKCCFDIDEWGDLVRRDEKKSL